jgi:hypothetical protein
VAEFKKSIYFLSRERIKYDSVTIWQALDKSTDPIEGIYENDTYQIAVLANKTPERDYYAVVTKSKTPLWEEGQVKFEFKKIEKSDYEYLLFYRNHSYQIGRVTAHNPVYKLLEELKKIHPQQTASTAATPETNFDNAPNGDWFQFKALNDSTNYVHIKTFDGSLKSKFDSAYQKIAPMIEQKNNLIIDVRDNGGGSDGCWRTLSKYLYTQPFDYDKTDVFCSTGTIKRYEEFLAEVKKNKKNYGATMVIFLRKRIKAMKKAPEGTFISTIKASVPWWARPLINQKSYKQSKIYASPKKVILIYNRNSASATEGLILAAKHSKKALSFGETSQGCIAFGDVMPTNTPIGFVLDVSVQYTPNRFQYEKVGIPPQVEAQPNKDWIEQANALWHLIK